MPFQIAFANVKDRLERRDEGDRDENMNPREIAIIEIANENRTARCDDHEDEKQTSDHLMGFRPLWSDKHDDPQSQGQEGRHNVDLNGDGKVREKLQVHVGLLVYLPFFGMEFMNRPARLHEATILFANRLEKPRLAVHEA